MTVEQGEALQFIVEKIGGKMGVTSKEQLLRKIAADFIQKFEDQYGVVESRSTVRGDKPTKPKD